MTKEEAIQLAADYADKEQVDWIAILMPGIDQWAAAPWRERDIRKDATEYVRVGVKDPVPSA